MAYSNPEIKGSFSTDVSKFPGTTNLEITDYKLILEKLGEPGLVENLDKGMFRLHFGNTIAFVTAETLIKAGVPHTFDLESVDRPSFMSDDVKVDVDFPGFGKTYFIVGHGATGRSETHLTNLEAVGRPMYISEACPDEIKPKAIEFLKRNGHVLLDAIIAQRVEGVYRNALRMHKAAMEKLEQGFDDVVFKGICRKHSYSQYRDVYYAAFELHHEEGDPSEIQLELSREDWTSAGEEGKQDVKGQHKFFFETFIKSIRGIFSHADQFLSLVDEFREAADLEVYRVDADDSHHRGREAEYHELIAQEKARAAELLWSCEEELATMP